MSTVRFGTATLIPIYGYTKFHSTDEWRLRKAAYRLAVSITATFLICMGLAQAGSPDDPPGTAAEPATKVVLTLPEALSGSAMPTPDSIGSGMNLTAFLAPGVPEDLTRAALRRAWRLDPAIHDFVGLSEDTPEPTR
jgi:hypothetical protein